MGVLNKAQLLGSTKRIGEPKLRCADSCRVCFYMFQDARCQYYCWRFEHYRLPNDPEHVVCEHFQKNVESV
jgi:hypothetical protein